MKAKADVNRPFAYDARRIYRCLANFQKIPANNAYIKAIPAIVEFPPRNPQITITIAIGILIARKVLSLPIERSYQKIYLNFSE